MEAYIFPLAITTVIFIFTLMALRIALPVLRKKHIGQTILEIGPNWHKSKEGTPTMGGIAPLFAILVSSIFFLLYAKDNNLGDILPFFITLLFAFSNACIGLIDDFTKLNKHQNKGLSPVQKLVLQSGFAAAYLLMLNCYGYINTRIFFPFTQLSFDLGWFWYVIAFLCILWFVNCANLTDGIDGLASSVGAVIGIFYLLASVTINNLSLTLCSCSLFGGALGFLMYNRHPAKIFMGDTGSLFFGALAIGCGFISGSYTLFFLFGFVYLLEGLSVVLQVVYFKLTKGKRLFKMAPLHHHLEKSGWSEWAITIFFSILTALFSFVALWDLVT